MTKAFLTLAHLALSVMHCFKISSFSRSKVYRLRLLGTENAVIERVAYNEQQAIGNKDRVF